MAFRKFNHIGSQSIIFTQKSQTIQSAKDEVDINNIVARYNTSGFLPADQGLGQYGDVTSLQSKDLTQHLSTLEQTSNLLDQFRAEQLQQQQQQYEEFQAWQAAQNSEPDPTPDQPIE